MELSFKAPSKEIDVELTIKRSRFIGSVRCTLNAEEAQEQLKAITEKYPKATHYCWAYRLGAGSSLLEHCSDAGEPAGTAGRPILGSLKRAGLENTLLVVTRYFGGVKLGVRGLIDAYGETAQLAADSCEPCEMEFCLPLTLACSYNYSKTLFTSLDKLGFTEETRKTTFAETVELQLEVPLAKTEELKQTLQEMYNRNFLCRYEWGTSTVTRQKQR